MSNAKGSDNKKVVATPTKVVASSRSEVRGVATDNLKQTVHKAVAMPASAVRAAAASLRAGAGAVRVGYDVVSRLLTLLESGIIIDKATLTATKGAIDAVGITDDIALITLGKAYDDICTLNDVLIRVVQYHRVYEEAAYSVDQPAKNLQKTVFSTFVTQYGEGIYVPYEEAIEALLSANPSFTYEEAAQYAKDYLNTLGTELAYPTDIPLITVGKNFSEVIELPETFSRLVSFNRSPEELISSFDEKSFTLSKPKDEEAISNDAASVQTIKPFVDTFGLSDQDYISLTKGISDIISNNDSRTLLFVKKIEDFILAADRFMGESGILAFSDSEVTLTSIADNLDRVVSFVRMYHDTTDATDALARNISKPKNDRLTISEQITRVADFNRQFSETNVASETFSRLVSYHRSYSEVVAPEETHAKSFSKAPFNDSNRVSDISTREYTKGLSNGGDVFDTFAKVVEFNRNLNSSANAIAMADIISTIKQYNRAFFEIPRATDVATKEVYFRRFVDETQQAVDVFTKTVKYNRFVDDIQNAVDVFEKVVSYNRTIIDVATAAETFTKVFHRPRSLNESIGTSDQITSKYITKQIADWLRIGDSLYFNSFVHPGTFPPADTQQITDSLRKIVSFVRTKTDTASASQTQTKQYAKVAGSVVSNIWSDFNDLGVYVELCQYYPDYRVEYIRLNETIGKNLSKRVGPFTYYTDATWTDFAELSVGLDIDQEIAQEFWRQAYSLDHDLVTFKETFSKTVSYVREFIEVTSVEEVTGRHLSRIVGDHRVRTFDDFAELFYTSESYVAIRGYGAKVQLEVVYSNDTFKNDPTVQIVIQSPGENYTAGQQFVLHLSNGHNVTIRVDSVYPFPFVPYGISGDLISIDEVIAAEQIVHPLFSPAEVEALVYEQYSGEIVYDHGIATASVVSVSPEFVRSLVLARFSAFMLSTVDDVDSRNNYVPSINYDYTYTDVEVGPQSLSRHNVIGQDLLFTLRDRADGDIVNTGDSVGRFFTKFAVDPYPEGFWTDYNELSFGSSTDQDLMQIFEKFKPTSINVVGTISLATLGFTKTNSLTANVLEARTLTFTKPAADSAAATAETFVKTFSKTAGEIQINTWTDYQEFLFSGLIGLEFGSKYDAIFTPETLAKNFTKTLYFDSYVWRDYNELSFATVRDEDMLFSWNDRQYTDIVRFAENTTREISKPFVEPLTTVETFSKEMAISGGDGRNPSHFRDWMGIYPIGETGPNGDPILDEELTLTFVPGSKTDFGLAADSAPKTFTKSPVITVAPFWSDFAELTFATQFDQELVQHQETTRPETIKTGDLFRRLWTIARTFNDNVTITDSALLSINGGPLFTLLMGTNDIATGSETLARFIGVAAGDVASYYSTWEDYAELTVALELAQYYYRGTDSTVDIGKITDQRANQFTKKGGRTQNIMDYAFEESIFYDRDLLQTFAQDYVTEIIIPADRITIDYGKDQIEHIRLTETMPRIITKPAVGDTIVPVDRNIWNPLYISGVSNYEEDIRFGNYPDNKVDSITLPEEQTNFATKSLGFGPAFSWTDYVETARSVYDLTLLTYGTYSVSNNAFAQTVFNRYLDEIVDDEHYEMIKTPYRTEIVAAAEYLFRTVSFVRTFEEAPVANSLAAKTVTPAPKQDSSSAAQLNTMQYGKAAGERRIQVWEDFVEVHPFNELAQNYPDYKTEWLETVDVATKFPKKAFSDAGSAFDSVLFVNGKNQSDTPVASTQRIKSFSKSLGEDSFFSWNDYGEVMSFDPRQLTFGSLDETKCDNTFSQDQARITYNKRAGDFRAQIWSDYTEIDNAPVYSDTLQYYPDYVTDMILPADAATININKRLVDTHVAFDSGAAMLHSPNGYAVNTPILYFADDYEDTIISSTF